MEASGQLHTPAASPPVIIRQEAEWDPKLVWTRWRKGKIRHCPCRKLNPGHAPCITYNNGRDLPIVSCRIQGHLLFLLIRISKPLQYRTSRFLSAWRWRQHGPLKRWYPTILHGVTTQKIWTWFIKFINRLIWRSFRN